MEASRFLKLVDLSRIMAFSDGIFAIAVTLLVLNLDVPELVNPSNASILEALSGMQVHLFAYLLSFIVIGLYWVKHHEMFNYIRKYDKKLIWLNLFFLLFISFSPFTTSLFSDYSEYMIPTVVYAVNFAITGFILSAIWVHATKNHKLVEKKLTDKFIQNFRLIGLVSPAVFTLSIPIAFFNPGLAHYSWFLIFIVISFMRKYL